MDKPTNYDSPTHGNIPVIQYADIYLRHIDEYLGKEFHILDVNFLNTVKKCNLKHAIDDPTSISCEEQRQILLLKAALVPVNIFEKKYVGIPFCEGGVWGLAIFCFLDSINKDDSVCQEKSKPRLRIFHTMDHGEDESIEETFKLFFVYETLHKLNRRKNVSDLEISHHTTLQCQSKQDSLYYVLSFARSLVMRPKSDFTCVPASVETWFTHEDASVIKNLIINTAINVQANSKDNGSRLKHENCVTKVVRCVHCGEVSSNLFKCDSCRRNPRLPAMRMYNNNRTLKKKFIQESFKSKYSNSSLSGESEAMTAMFDSLGKEHSSKQNQHGPLDAPSFSVVDRCTGHPSGRNNSVTKVNDIVDSDYTADTSQDGAPILRFPPTLNRGVTGCVTLHLSDYKCLGEHEFLNDSIIEFYLWFIYLRILSDTDRERTHIFSTFFYKRMTNNINFNAGDIGDIKDELSEIMYSRVKNWTKSVDIFSKDFLIIPINASWHWIMAIVCFPGLEGAVRTSDDSVLSPDDDDAPIKQPCILILDSSDSDLGRDVPMNLINYLKMEYKHKKQGDRSFESCKAIFPSVPQQTNGSDCGLFILQYAESFFEEPIQNFKESLNLRSWFPLSVINGKRVEISNVIRMLMQEQNICTNILPELNKHSLIRSSLTDFDDDDDDDDGGGGDDDDDVSDKVSETAETMLVPQNSGDDTNNEEESDSLDKTSKPCDDNDGLKEPSSTPIVTETCLTDAVVMKQCTIVLQKLSKKVQQEYNQEKGDSENSNEVVASKKRTLRKKKDARCDGKAAEPNASGVAVVAADMVDEPNRKSQGCSHKSGAEFLDDLIAPDLTSTLPHSSGSSMEVAIPKQSKKKNTQVLVDNSEELVKEPMESSEQSLSTSDTCNKAVEVPIRKSSRVSKNLLITSKETSSKKKAHKIAGRSDVSSDENFKVGDTTKKSSTMHLRGTGDLEPTVMEEMKVLEEFQNPIENSESVLPRKKYKRKLSILPNIKGVADEEIQSSKSSGSVQKPPSKKNNKHMVGEEPEGSTATGSKSKKTRKIISEASEESKQDSDCSSIEEVSVIPQTVQRTIPKRSKRFLDLVPEVIVSSDDSPEMISLKCPKLTKTQTNKSPILSLAKRPKRNV